jgi:N-acetylglucosamine-6-sulfatase
LPRFGDGLTLVSVSLTRRELWILVALMLIAALVGYAMLGATSRGHDDAPRAAQGRPAHPRARIAHPNILVVTTDDQTLSQFDPAVMPFTWRFFRRAGSTFTNSLSTPPLCCPSRAGFLTGEYAHNHGVLTNDYGYSYLRHKGNTLPVWLDRAGYRTGLVGKYLNGYPAMGPQTAPGWDDFFVAAGAVEYFDFDVGVNGTSRHYGGRQYSTSVYTGAAERFVRSSARRREPFFLWLTYNAPHTVPDSTRPCGGVKAQPRRAADYRRFANTPLPQSPAAGERDVRDKDRWVQRRAPMSSGEVAAAEKRWRCALASLSPVDRGLRSIVGELHRLGEFDRTIIVFTSDNGYFYGEHGIPDDKELPYDPALRVPLAIAVPPAVGGASPPASIDALVSNVDLAPTLLDYAQARPCAGTGHCRTVDGHSLRPLLAGHTPTWTRNRAIPIELADDFTYTGLRTRDVLYMRLVRDPLGCLQRPEEELYDLRSDPFERHNLWATDRAVNQQRQRRLVARLQRVSGCAGTSGPRGCP